MENRRSGAFRERSSENVLGIRLGDALSCRFNDARYFLRRVVFVCLARRSANGEPPARVQRCPRFLRADCFCRHRFAKAYAFARNGDDKLSTGRSAFCLPRSSLGKGEPPARSQRCPHFLRAGGFWRHRFAKAQRCAYFLRTDCFWRHRFAKAYAFARNGDDKLSTGRSAFCLPRSSLGK